MRTTHFGLLLLLLSLVCMPLAACSGEGHPEKVSKQEVKKQMEEVTNNASKVLNNE